MIKLKSLLLNEDEKYKRYLLSKKPFLKRIKSDVQKSQEKETQKQKDFDKEIEKHLQSKGSISKTGYLTKNVKPDKEPKPIAKSRVDLYPEKTPVLRPSDDVDTNSGDDDIEKSVIDFLKRLEEE